jgi:uncharacterized membrane protein YwzB
MFLETFNPVWIILLCLFVVFFLISYYVITATNLERLFKQGHIVEIKTAYIIVAFITATLLTFGVKLLVDLILNYIP